MRRFPALALTVALAAPLVGVAEPAQADERPSFLFCAGLARADAIGSPGGPNDPTPAQMRSWSRRVAPHLRTMNRNAPSKLRPHTGAMVNAMDAAGRGDVNALGEVATKARNTVEDYAYENCGWRRLNVTGKDYRFQNVPEVLPRGANIVRLKNKGDEFHVLVWQRRRFNDRRAPAQALTDDWNRYTASPTSARFRALGFLDMETAAAGPDDTGYAVASLSRGRYIVFCPVHVEDSGDMHFNRGMWDVIEVP